MGSVLHVSISTWSWLDHSVSGLFPKTNALFRLAFATPTPFSLSLLLTKTRWPMMQKVHSHFFETWIVLFAFHFRFFSLPSRDSYFTFPSQYSSLSVFLNFFDVRGGFPFLWTFLTGPTLFPFKNSSALRGFNPLWRSFPLNFLLLLFKSPLFHSFLQLITPFLRFRSPLLTVSRLIFFLGT